MSHPNLSDLVDPSVYGRQEVLDTRQQELLREVLSAYDEYLKYASIPTSMSAQFQGFALFVFRRGVRYGRSHPETESHPV